jgi:hypothetical protein
MSNVNKFQDSYRVLKKIHDFVSKEKKKVQGLIYNNIFKTFHPRFLPQTPYILMYIKYMSVKKTKCPIIM